jgi:hypothetical protein
METPRPVHWNNFKYGIGEKEQIATSSENEVCVNMDKKGQLYSMDFCITRVNEFLNRAMT